LKTQQSAFLQISKPELKLFIDAHRCLSESAGHAKVVFDNQGKNSMHFIKFWLGIFLFKIEKVEMACVFFSISKERCKHLGLFINDVTVVRKSH